MHQKQKKYYNINN